MFASGIMPGDGLELELCKIICKRACQKNDCWSPSVQYHVPWPLRRWARSARDGSAGAALWAWGLRELFVGRKLMKAVEGSR